MRAKLRMSLAWILAVTLVWGATPALALAAGDQSEAPPAEQRSETADPDETSGENAVVPAMGTGRQFNAASAVYKDGAVSVEVEEGVTLEDAILAALPDGAGLDDIWSLTVTGKIATSDLDFIYYGVSGSPQTGLPALRELDLSGSELNNTKFPDSQFMGDAQLEWIALPANIETIGVTVFSGCENLEEVLLPASLKVIGWRAFVGCTSLKSIDLTKSIEMVECGNNQWNPFDQAVQIKVPQELLANYQADENWNSGDGALEFYFLEAPADFTATPGNGRVVLNWDVPTDLGAVTVAGYETRIDSEEWMDAKGMAHTYGELADGVAYQFSVRAYALQNNGTERVYGLESTASATPAAELLLPPGAPTNLKTTSGDRKVTLAWDLPEDKVGFDNDIAYYRVSDDGKSWKKTDEDETEDRSYVFTGLSNSTTYTFYVKAVNAGGEEGEAVTASAKPKAGDTVATVRGGSGSISQYTVTFDTKGGDAVARQNVYPNSKVTVPRVPNRPGYTFTGWYTNEICTAKYNFDSPVTGDMTLYAGWEWSEDVTGKVQPYISGYPDGTFRPDAGITRGEAVQVLYNLNGGQAGSANGSSTFYDVPADSWYYSAVMSLTGSKAVSGYADGSFKPEQTITRAEFVTMVARYAGLVEGSNPNFSDVSNSHWAAKYIAAAQNNGLASGSGDGTFKPDAPITRAEVVTMMNRMLGRNTNSGLFGAVTMPFSDVPYSHWARYEVMAAAIEH